MDKGRRVTTGLQKVVFHYQAEGTHAYVARIARQDAALYFSSDPPRLRLIEYGSGNERGVSQMIFVLDVT